MRCDGFIVRRIAWCTGLFLRTNLLENSESSMQSMGFKLNSKMIFTLPCAHASMFIIDAWMSAFRQPLWHSSSGVGRESRTFQCTRSATIIVHSKLSRYCYSSCMDKPIHQKIETQDTQYLFRRRHYTYSSVAVNSLSNPVTNEWQRLIHKTKNVSPIAETQKDCQETNTSVCNSRDNSRGRRFGRNRNSQQRVAGSRRHRLQGISKEFEAWKAKKSKGTYV